MTLDTWFLYAAACAVLTLIPGPSVFMVLSQTLSRGLSAGLICIFGTLASGLFVIPASYAGLGVILTVSSQAFQFIKWAGVVYLAWLGFSQCLTAYRLQPGHLVKPDKEQLQKASFLAGFLTGLLNPKAIVFYASFMAQFMSPNEPLTPQFLVLMVTTLVIIFLGLAAYALIAQRARQLFTTYQSRKRIEYFGGFALLTGSIGLATKE